MTLDLDGPDDHVTRKAASSRTINASYHRSISCVSIINNALIMEHNVPNHDFICSYNDIFVLVVVSHCGVTIIVIFSLSQ